ncbi:MAG: SDR family oxidoreductase [Oxalobacteraceae bacterium]|jgi:NAD(P)-dependent dehydrogenase (short-subunit alcohol dehydrogenase family)|nr:SDR family oxidoreductase [Oxalobacteraceae bacterium]
MSTSTSRVALITGAGTGIGKATAKALLGAGYHVVLSGRNLDKLEKAIQEIGGTADNCLAVACDVGKPASVKEMFAKLKAKFHRLDVLFNNAGTFTTATLAEDIKYEDWISVVDTNLTGSFLCAQEAIRMMKEQSPKGGRIINNGSISAHAPRPLSLPYTATKHAITGLTKSIALDYRNDNIACSQIDIGNAATEMTQKMANGILQADGSTKVEPRMNADHVAQAVVQIAQLPLESNVLFMTIMATNMPYVGRG